MSTRPNLADPDYEPTDEELIGLAQRAFAHVRENHERSLRKLREEIAEERKRALARLAEPIPPKDA